MTMVKHPPDRGEGVISVVAAAQMCVARVRDEVTHTLIEESSTAVFKGGEVSFLYEVAERIFVLRQHL